MASPSLTRLAIVIGAVLASLPAGASKFTGPVFVEMHCRVVALIDERRMLAETRASDARVTWDLRRGDGEVLVRAERLAVASYDNHGWATAPYRFQPRQLYVSLPPSLAGVGRTVLVRIEFAPSYEGKLSIAGTIFRPILKGPSSHSPEAVDGRVARIRALPNVSELAAARWPDDVEASLVEERRRKRASFRLDRRDGVRQERCSTGEHLVPTGELIVEGRGRERFTITALALHEIELHGGSFSPAQAAQLDHILR